MRKNSSRLFLFVLALTLIFSLLACKKEDTEKEAENDTVVTTTTAVTTTVAPLDDYDEWTKPIL